jgi:hypothetical protein
LIQAFIDLSALTHTLAAKFPQERHCSQIGRDCRFRLSLIRYVDDGRYGQSDVSGYSHGLMGFKTPTSTALRTSA